MQAELRPEIGNTVSIPKGALDVLLTNLRGQGYEVVGPRIQNDTLVYGPLDSIDSLPRGYTTEQEAGHFRLVYKGHARYFDVIPGAASWKQFLFPPIVDLFTLRKSLGEWRMDPSDNKPPAYAFIGVRGCELAAIQVQDVAFLRSDFRDPIYRAAREQAFILAVNCTQPAGTCFCQSMGTGPRVRHGYDLNLTEMDDRFLLEIGSDLGLSVISNLPYEPASAFMLNAANQEIEKASRQMGRELDTQDLPDLLLNHLEAPHWKSIAERCLSCANCTQVCPTCFCWDARDTISLDGNETKRERVWDSCFNPGYSYQAGGNSRPTIHSRYRQWLTHKLGSWMQQYGTSGCVGCGRCITWCPAGIDITAEVAALRKEVG